MAWIFVGVTLFLGLVLAIITKIVYPLFTQVFEAYDNLNNSIKENITNMRVVKSYVKEKEETDNSRGLTSYLQDVHACHSCGCHV